MLNKIQLEGKVLNCYIHNGTGAFICKIAVPHEHILGNTKITCESVFNTVMHDEKMIKQLDVMQGDKVLLEGYLKLDHKTTLGGNDHQTVRVYATDIQVVKPKMEHGIVDTTKLALGM